MTELTVTNQFDGTETELPEHIIERTENLLSVNPMTNQSLILDTAQWWLERGGNCPIYRWCIHHLDTLEHDNVTERVSVYSDARKQAKSIGLSV